MPYCPFCGSEVSEEDTFCGSCGAMLNGGAVPGRRPDGSSTKKLIAILIVTGVLIATMAGAVTYVLMEAYKESEKEDITVRYSWKYGTVPGVEHSFSYTLTVERSYYNNMMKSTIDRSGSVSADRYLNDGKTVFAVSDYIVVDTYITKVANDLYNMYKQKFGNPTNDDYVKFVTAFVQICIKYDWDESESGSEYWRFPLETLCDKKGDCEDTSILLAALIDAKGIGGGVILVTSHAMCAVDSADLIGAYYNLNHSDVYDKDFYPIETTYDDFETIGDIGAAQSVEYMHLYMGHSTTYFTS